jgi:hypothetical protein
MDTGRLSFSVNILCPCTRARAFFISFFSLFLKLFNTLGTFSTLGALVLEALFDSRPLKLKEGEKRKAVFI